MFFEKVNIIKRKGLKETMETKALNKKEVKRISELKAKGLNIQEIAYRTAIEIKTIQKQLMLVSKSNKINS